MNDVRKIKQLQSQLDREIADAEALKIQVANIQRTYNQKLQNIIKLKSSISSLNSNEGVKVSEHAILRYLERVKGLNIEELQKEILTDEVLILIEKLGVNGKYPVNNFQIVMKDGVVTTII